MSFRPRSHRQPTTPLLPQQKSLIFIFLGFSMLPVREYSTWQQSRLSEKVLKAEVRKACEVALDDGLDLVQIVEDKIQNTSRRNVALSTVEWTGSPVHRNCASLQAS
ncbi:hypothetical protein N7512_009244 [Penicillium capsulatum]|nr:hypothetical protein N7512_009244 [Penicillium capsulatum]